MKRNVALSITLVSLVAGSPCLALDFESLLRNYLGGVGTNVNVVDNQADVKTSINTRQAQLEHEVEVGAAAGRLTREEEQDLRNQLNHVAFVEGVALRDGTLTDQEIQGIVDELTTISRNVNTYMTNATVSGYASTARPGDTSFQTLLRNYLGTGSGDAAVSNQAAVNALIESREAELDGAIESALIAGRINWNDAHSLRSELLRTNTLQTNFLADAKLTYTEEKQLVDHLNSIDSLLKAKVAEGDRWMASNRGRGNSWGRTRRTVTYRSALRARIDQGVTSGKLTPQEAGKLIQMEDQIRELERQLRISGGRLTYSEERQLNARRDRLSARITKELNDKQVW